MSEVNFLPASYLERQAQRRRSLWQSAILVLAVLAGIAFWSAQAMETSTLRHTVEALETEAEAVRQEQTAAARLITEYKSLLHQTRVQRELAQPVTQSQVLAVLGKVLPAEVSLVRIELHAVRPKPAAADPAASKGKSKSKTAKRDAPAAEPEYLDLTLEALASDDLTVANVVGLLSKHPLFGEVRMQHSRAVVVRDLPLRTFALTMRVDLRRDIQPRRAEVAYAD